MPQLGLQLCALILTLKGVGGNDSDSTRTSLLITIFSMAFTSISILLSAFEYVLSIQMNEHGTAIMFKIPFESKMVANVSRHKFSKTFIYSNKNDITHLVSKTLYLSHRQVETLMPVQSKDGLVFSFIIMVDSIYFDHLWKELQQAVQTKSFIAKMKSIYHITDQVSADPTKLTKFILNSNKSIDKKHDDNDELILQEERELALIESQSPSHTATPSYSIN